ncbi:MAG: hypothetical protein V3W04_06875 [Gammaproteobacteria bacterium]
MKRILITLFAPPVSVCKFGCAGCCAAPISVFWLAGLASLVYGLLGGPTNMMGISWTTIWLGLALWSIAAIWAAVAIHNTDLSGCESTKPLLCQPFTTMDETDPFDEVKKAKS